MRPTFARRLLFQAILTIGGSLTALALGISLFLFFSYVQNLNARNAIVRERVPEAFRMYRVPADNPDAGARAIVRQANSVGLRILVFNNRMLVVATAVDPDDPHSAIAFERGFYGQLRTPARSLSERLAFGFATAFGLRAEHVSLADVGVEINADPAALLIVLRRFVLLLVGLLLAIATFAYASASILRREALRPLEEVVDALEAFGAGDLQPRPVQAARNDEFGRLAGAYNRAAAEVSTAFAERERAEAEIRRFIADAAHQLRTPLTVIQGFIGILLKNDPRAQADRERILYAMDRQSRSMAAMISKLTLLDSWEAAQAKPQLTDIGDCVAGVIQSVAAAFPDRVSLAQEPACYTLVDAGEIREAFGNVLDNALKYGGESPVTVSVGKTDHRVRVVVADHGPGMTDEDKRHAFERFYRGDHRQVAGSGLGLAIAKRAIERAGGSVSIASRPGDGTAVTIDLPATAVTIDLPTSVTPSSSRGHENRESSE